MQAKERMVWKIRNVKNYPGAHNHLNIGEVIEHTDTWVRIKGHTYHFGKTVNRLSDIKSGPLMVRIIPWNRIEVIHQLPGSFDYENARVGTDENGSVVLADGSASTRIITAYEKSL